MIDVVMPQMGESITEGTLTRWLKKPGEKVERDEPLFEISTDKVDTEIPSPEAGVLSEVLVQEGTTVAINSVVARIGDSANGSAPAAAAAPPPPAPATPPPAPAAAPQAAPPAPQTEKADVGPSARAEGVGSTPPPSAAAQSPAPATPPPPPPATPQADGSEEPGPLSPLVRKMAREYNVDLAKVKGTGVGGRITKQDVESYMAAQAGQSYTAPPAPQATAAGPYPVEPKPETPAAAPQAAASDAKAASSPAPAAKPAQPSSGSMPLAEAPRSTVEPMTTMRQKIAEHMIMSQRTSAHVTTVHRVDMTKVAKLRDRSKAEFQARNGFSLTFLPFVAQATAEALRSFPIFNA
jgi:pyruvate dehydrogenase E2 component (dihydrolipoamide acetyltransferase)